MTPARANMLSGSRNNGRIARHERLKIRSKIISAIRSWLEGEGFLEVHTPILVNTLAPEPYIETFRTTDVHGSGSMYLIPSPELNLKRLLSEGLNRIYQLGPVFRRGERGDRHLPEFTMLEWYRTDADYKDLMADCEAILQTTAKAIGLDGEGVVYGRNVIDIRPPFTRLTVEDAFIRYAGWCPGPWPDPNRFNEDMATKIEPGLPKDRPIFLMDYPASCAAMARPKPSNPSVAERVELYIGGIELANGFSELTDRYELEERFREWTIARKRLGFRDYPWPQRFISCLDSLKPCAGMSLGVDRLVMLLTNTSRIDDVIAFTPEVS
ncbi:MAG: EF-P lysine aminoacylase EpmA [Dissulfurimicrobium sp.]|uniref:EF-P lysine aminoacylase EpmA n=1 Tax=Dissulfurimicrobium sp. TaxID=2022436 RepID=UPI003D0C6746